jgi:hypothetical protein
VSPLIEQLLPDSQELLELRTLTTNAINSGACEYLIAKQVLIAKRENIVVNLPFCEDPPPRPIDADHTSICKPLNGDSESLGYLIKSIRGRAVGAQ